MGFAGPPKRGAIARRDDQHRGKHEARNHQEPSALDCCLEQHLVAVGGLGVRSRLGLWCLGPELRLDRHAMLIGSSADALKERPR